MPSPAAAPPDPTETLLGVFDSGLGGLSVLSALHDDKRMAQLTGDILRDTPVALLAEGQNLNDRFTVAQAGMDGELQHLNLEPKTADADFRRVELWLQPSGVPVRMRLHDPLGGISDIRFSDVQRNVRIDAAQFRFTPPKGVEVVQMDGGSP